MTRIVGRIATLALAGLLVSAASHAGEVAENIGPEKLAWPNWRGPYCNGTALPYEGALVTDLDKAEKLWQSEAEIPSSNEDKGPGGGYADPIVAYGNVYQ